MRCHHYLPFGPFSGNYQIVEEGNYCLKTTLKLQSYFLVVISCLVSPLLLEMWKGYPINTSDMGRPTSCMAAFLRIFAIKFWSKLWSKNLINQLLWSETLLLISVRCCSQKTKVSFIENMVSSTE